MSDTNVNDSVLEPLCMRMENPGISRFIMNVSYVVVGVGFGVGTWQLERDGDPSLELACYLVIFALGFLSFLSHSIFFRSLEKKIGWSVEAYAKINLGTATKTDATKTDEGQGNSTDAPEGPDDSSPEEKTPETPFINFFLIEVGFGHLAWGVVGLLAAALDWSLETQAAICLVFGIYMAMVTLMVLFLRIIKHPQSRSGFGLVCALIGTSVMMLYLGGRGMYLAHHM